MAYGQVIKKARISKLWTQADLARAVKTSRQSVGAWEAERVQPDTLNVAALESALNLQPGTLLKAVHENPTRAPRGVSKLCGAC